MELDIAGLDTAGRDELLEHWRCLIGRPPPKHISRSLLIQILAWEQQSGLYGGFTKKLSLRLTRAGLRDVMRPAFKPGSRFVREYHGKTHVVEVAEDGWLCGTRSALSPYPIQRAPLPAITYPAFSSLE